MNKQPKSFKSLMVRAILRPIIIVSALVIGYGVSSMVNPADFGSVDRPIVTAPTKAETLMDRHDCWNGEAPADMVGVIPGHVIITEAGRTYRAGSVKVGTALDVIFNGAESEIEKIHGFCR